MKMDLCLDLELGMGNYIGFFLAEVWTKDILSCQGPVTDPRGTPYESVTSWIVANFSNKKKTKFVAVQIIHTNM